MGTLRFITLFCLLLCVFGILHNKKEKNVMKERLNASSSICREIVCNWGLAFREDFLMGLPLEQRAEGSLVEGTLGRGRQEYSRGGSSLCKHPGIGAERGQFGWSRG